MKVLLILGVPLAVSLLAGCTAHRAPFSAMGNPRYAAIGENPFWMAAINGRRIVLTLGAGPGTRPGSLNNHSYAGVVRQQTGDITRWEAGKGTGVIAVEARPGPCTAGGREYTDRVTIGLSGRMLEGCGGMEISGRRGR